MNLVSYTPSIAELNIALSDEEFELLLRQRLTSAFLASALGNTMIMLIATTDYGSKNKFKEAHWNIGTSSEQTKGEILSQCIVEYNRRKNFEKSCTLLLLEAQAEVIDTKEIDEALGIIEKI